MVLTWCRQTYPLYICVNSLLVTKIQAGIINIRTQLTQNLENLTAFS